MRRIIGIALIATALTSCTAINKSMREPNSRIEFYADDFEFSEIMKASATSTKIIGIDFSRLFTAETGTVANDNNAVGAAITTIIAPGNIPVIGNYVGDRTANYALYNLMQDNPGYDVVFYPSYRTTVEAPIGIPLYTITTVEVSARLAKIK